MDQETTVILPQYRQIAIDLAKQIANGKYRNGERISSRTSIASRYNVSPETARRAFLILTELEIVEANKGSGVIILSQEKAQEFAARYSQINTIGQLKQEIIDNIKIQQKQVRHLEDSVHSLFEKTNRLRIDNPLQIEEIVVKSPTIYLDKTVSDINFWHNTGATVVAIRRGTELLMSPGPYARFCEGDIIMFVGDFDVYERVRLFLYGND